MTSFQIQFSDEHFRLIVISAGEEEYNEPVRFCSFSSVVGIDGRVYAAYLRSSEPDLDEIEQNPDPDFISMPSKSIKVYDVTDFPAIKEAQGIVILIAAEFPEIEEDDEEDEDEEAPDTIDVEPVR